MLFSIQDTAEYHSPTLTHMNDTDPVRIYAETGSIEYVPESSGDAATLKGGLVLELVELRVEARQGIDHGREDGHGRCGAREAFELVLHPLV